MEFSVNKAAYMSYGYCKESPQHTVKRAYLSAEVEAVRGIVPDAQLEAIIENESGKQLCDRDDGAAYQTFQSHSTDADTAEYFVQSRKAKPSGKDHRPMRMPPPDDLKQTVCGTAQRKKYAEA